ncbi:hypothetical protein [Paenibacillus sp. HB172176]|uniref:hypothetical protein n=1 Tax=Paenibacillus sp. HB172176 TaxID=2493690 RepID=UPI00143C1B0E|nr:hypothetical protein [Paenibacillus sp. HB172176]
MIVLAKEINNSKTLIVHIGCSHRNTLVLIKDEAIENIDYTPNVNSFYQAASIIMAKIESRKSSLF